MSLDPDPQEGDLGLAGGIKTFELLGLFGFWSDPRSLVFVFVFLFYRSLL